MVFGILFIIYQLIGYVASILLLVNTGHGEIDRKALIRRAEIAGAPPSPRGGPGLHRLGSRDAAHPNITSEKRYYSCEINSPKYALLWELSRMHFGQHVAGVAVGK
jgi:hypothetical protein